MIKPGETKHTLTFDRPKSKYKLSAKLFNADFEGPYPVEFGSPLYPAIEETIVIVPLFLFLKYFSTALILFKVPKKLILKTSSICSISISFSLVGFHVPVEKKQISIFSNLFLIFSKTSLHLDLSVTSNGNELIFSCLSEISLRRFSRLAEIATFHPPG